MGYIYADAVFHNPIDYTEFVQGKRRLRGVRFVAVSRPMSRGAAFLGELNTLFSTYYTPGKVPR